MNFRRDSNLIINLDLAILFSRDITKANWHSNHGCFKWGNFKLWDKWILLKLMALVVFKLFLHKRWNIVGKLICNMVRCFFNHSHMLKELKRTYITLVPKNNNPVNGNHYRPISLYSILCKVISKVLANKLKKVLPKLFHFARSFYSRLWYSW